MIAIRIRFLGVPLLLCLALGGAAPALAQAPAAPLREIVITFDDLPLVIGRPASIEEHERVTTALLDAVTRHRVPAIGFVNEDKLEVNGRVDARQVALLRQWLRAGLELGNHSYAHVDLHRTTIDQYRRNIVRGDSITRSLLAESGQAPRFFRHPLLHTGRDTATRNGVTRFLASRGYRVAPVTVDNYDYIFARAFDRAIAAGDTALERRVRDEYLAYMERVLVYYESQSIKLLGRNIPHVLLLHANTLNARTFDALATMYTRRGYRFVGLEHALRDPAYGMRDEYTGPAGITWLQRWALTRGDRGAVFAGEPEVPGWIEQAAALR